MPKLAIVIVSWNGKLHLETCLSALREQTYRNFKTLLVDNGSEDGTCEFIREHFPEVELIELKENTGFAWPNNLGIQKALDDPEVSYIVTLNNDCKPDPNYLSEMLDCAKRYPSVGSVQPKVTNYYEQHVIDSTGMLISRNMCAINRGYKEDDEGQYERGFQQLRYVHSVLPSRYRQPVPGVCRGSHEKHRQ